MHLHAIGEKSHWQTVSMIESEPVHAVDWMGSGVMAGFRHRRQMVLGGCADLNGARRSAACELPAFCEPGCGMQDFEACTRQLRSSRLSWAVPDDAPLHGIGHSNGALMHLLLGAIAAQPYASTVIISFNNKCACPACCRVLELVESIPSRNASIQAFVDFWRQRSPALRQHRLHLLEPEMRLPCLLLVEPSTLNPTPRASGEHPFKASAHPPRRLWTFGSKAGQPRAGTGAVSFNAACATSARLASYSSWHYAPQSSPAVPLPLHFVLLV